MNINKGEDIILTLQLIKSDGVSVEDEAIVSYKIIDNSGINEVVSSTVADYNNITKSYTNTIIPSAGWINQEIGSYLIVWTVSNTDDDFNDTYTENIEIGLPDVDIKRLLGLMHENIYIDNPIYDANCNLKSARVRIYSDSVSVGTAINVIGTYEITAPSNAPGKFTTWQQVRTS